jgi:hypothetical protein
MMGDLPRGTEIVDCFVSGVEVSVGVAVGMSVGTGVAVTILGVAVA